MQIQKIHLRLYECGFSFLEFDPELQLNRENEQASCIMHISQRHLGTNVQIETTQLQLIQNKIHFHAKGLFPIHNRTYIKVKCVELGTISLRSELIVCFISFPANGNGYYSSSYFHPIYGRND